MQYLDKALSTLRDLRLLPEKRGEAAPITALLNQISDLDDQRTALIARTLDQMSLFNEVVRAQIIAMDVGERYNKIAEVFGRAAAAPLDDVMLAMDVVDNSATPTSWSSGNSRRKNARGKRDSLLPPDGYGHSFLPKPASLTGWAAPTLDHRREERRKSVCGHGDMPAVGAESAPARRAMGCVLTGVGRAERSL